MGWIKKELYYINYTYPNWFYSVTLNKALRAEIKKTELSFLEYLSTLQFFSEISWPLKRVYWVDTYLDYIEAVDYDGGNRKTILRGSPVQNLYSASVFENSLYLTSWRNNSILRVNKFHPVKVRIFWEGHKNMIFWLYY